mgnify:CR=1 FL=1
MNRLHARRSFPWLAAALLGALFLPACGGDEGTDAADVASETAADVPVETATDPGGEAVDPGMPDTPQEIPPDVSLDLPLDLPSMDVHPVPPHPLFDFVGGIWMVEYPNPDYPSSVIDVRANDKPDAPTHDLSASEGACQLWVAKGTPPACTPPCASGHYCRDGKECVAYPVRVGMGNVLIDAAEGMYSFVPDESSWYTGPTSLPANLFDPSTVVTVTAAGGTIPAFERTLSGIADLVPGLADGRITLENGKDNTLSWTPAGDSSTIEVVLQTGWHGRPPETILWCTGPDAAGKVVMPQALVEGVGYLDPDSPSLFQHPSFVRRVKRLVVETAGGPLEVTLTSQVGVVLKHLW